MKGIYTAFSISLFVFFFFPNISTAQTEECGTETPTNYQHPFEVSPKEFDEFVEDLNQKVNSEASCITYQGIRANIVRTSAGTGGLSVADLNAAMTLMNIRYEAACMAFYICGPINYIDDDTYYDFDKTEETALTTAYNVSNLINVYFVNSVTSSGNTICGYASFPGGANRIIMDNSCTNNGSTLTHEFGHFFGLYHTHEPFFGFELVNGSNCTTAGDRICDTPADPQLGSSNVSASCMYTGTSTDANGDTYVPNPNNIMSYSLKPCRSFYSPEQLSVLSFNFYNVRNTFMCTDIYADFMADVTTDCATPMTVNFESYGVGITSYSWDFENDGVVDATTADATHTYTTSGVYTVKLVASDGVNVYTELKTSYISAGIKALPYTTNLDNFTPSANSDGYLEGWTTSFTNTPATYRWNLSQGGTPSSSTGPTVDQSTGTATGVYAFTEASGADAGDVAELISPCVDVPTGGSSYLSFWYHMYGASMGTLHVDVNNGTTWINDVNTPLVGQQQTTAAAAWVENIVDLTSYAGQAVQVRFRAERGTDFTSDMAIDNINFYNDAPVPPVAEFSASATTVTTCQNVVFADQSTGAPTSYLWTFLPNTVTYHSFTSFASSNPEVRFTAPGNYTITLTATNAGGSTTETKTNYITVTEGVGLPIFPHTDMQGSFPPTNWSIVNTDNNITWQSASVMGSDGNLTDAARVNNYNYNTSGLEDELLSAAVKLPDGNSTLSFDVAYAPYDVNNYDALRVEVYTDCGYQYAATLYEKANLALATAPAYTASMFEPSGASEWRNETIDLSAYAGQIVTLKFINVNGFGNALYLDNINLMVDYYPDTDGDNYGDFNATLITALHGSAPTGYISSSLSDCDDMNSDTYPGAPELCDGLDNNCNNMTDEGLPDMDGDTVADCIDNCPNVPNASQTNMDGDNFGDDCDCNDNDPHDENIIVSGTIENNYEANGTITATGIIKEEFTITMQAATEIILMPTGNGFTASQGSDFTAAIGNCENIPSFTNPVEARLSEEKEEAVSDELFEIKEVISLSIAPNPFRESTTISIELNQAQLVNLYIYDATGSLLEHKLNQAFLEAGAHQFEFSAERLKAGVYYVVVNTEYQNVVKKMVVVQ